MSFLFTLRIHDIEAIVVRANPESSGLILQQTIRQHLSRKVTIGCLYSGRFLSFIYPAIGTHKQFAITISNSGHPLFLFIGNVSECFSLHIEFTDSFCGKYVYQPLSIAANSSDSTSQQSGRIPFFLLIGFNAITVINIQTIPGSNPDLSPFVIIKCIYGKLRKSVIGSQIIERHILCISRRKNGKAQKKK